MMIFYSTIKTHIHCPYFASLVLTYRLLVIKWHQFMQPYYTENTHNLALDRIITIAVFGDTIGKKACEIIHNECRPSYDTLFEG